MLRVGKSINYLLTNSEVDTLLEGRIFPVIAELGTKFPFITYRRTGSGNSDSKDKLFEDTASIELVIASTSYTESMNIALKCREALENKRYDNIKDIQLTDASEDYIDEAFILNLVFTIKIIK